MNTTVKNSTLGISSTDAEFVEQEIILDAKIENVLRSIQATVIVFFNDYKHLINIVEDSTNIRNDIAKIRTCSEKLIPIKDMCHREMQNFANMGKDFKGTNMESKYLLTLNDLGAMIADLDKYVTNLNKMVVQVENGAMTDSETIKAEFRLFGLLQQQYDSFINKDEQVIAELTDIDNISKKK